MTREFNFMIGGEAGQGVQSLGLILSKTLARGGYHIFADQDYESRVRGGHNFFRVRVKDSSVGAIIEQVDLLIALNRESVDLHRGELSDGGIGVFDGGEQEENRKDLVNVPLERLAEESAGDELMTNTVALGAALGLIDYGLEILRGVLTDYFGGKVAEKNLKAAQAGFDYVRKNGPGHFRRRLRPTGEARRMLLTGNDALSLGAIAAGCRFMSAYPMTPASSIMEYFASKEKELDLVMVHAEDEIAAVNMAIGAGFAGARAMTATSGSGFCLMAEGLGMAGITETPVVIINAQRPGPAVGLPTRTEQGDLLFVLHAHHGDFPRAVLAPASVEDAFRIAVKSFNLAEKYQLPVIILTDQHLASSYTTVDRFDLAGVNIDRGQLYSPEKGKETEYKRHKVTKSGVSPRALPGMSKAIVVTDSDEHDEAGHLTEDAGDRNAQVEKRLRKLKGLGREISPPKQYGSDSAEVMLIGWGSSYGALREATDILKREGVDVNLLHLNELWPFPARAVARAMEKAGRCCVVESNATGQLARLIRAETGIEARGQVLRYDGRPLTPAYIVDAVKREGC